jgi:hypothetical protein
LGGRDRVPFDGTQNFGDLFGRRRTAFGQLPDFIGHEGKAATVLAGARCLDSGIEREQIRLIGDVFDRINDLFDLRGD